MGSKLMAGKTKKYKDLAVNTVVFSISSFGSKILTFLLVPLYTSLLSTAEYGIADVITSTSSLLIFVLTLNIADSVLRFAIERKEKQEEILSFGLKVQFYGALVLSAGLFVIRQLGILNWADHCYVFLLLIFFSNAVNMSVTSYLRAVNKVKDVAVSGIIQTASMITSNILCLIVFRMGIVGYLLSILIGMLISSLYCFIRIGTPITDILKSAPDKIVQKDMIKYSTPLIFNGVAWWMNSSLDKYFIISIVGVGASGIYAVAAKIPTILKMFNQIFSQAWNLSAIHEYDKDDKDGFFSNMYSVYNAGMVLSCSVLILFNVFLAKILYAKDFFVALNYTSPLLISVVFSALSSFIGSIFSAVKNSKIYAVSTVAAAIVNTILNAVLIPRWGIQGAAIATAVSFFTIWIIRFICVQKYIKLKINLKRDALAYILLSVQAVIEHYNGHNYMYQGAIICVLLLIYFKELKMILVQLPALADKFLHKNRKK